MLSSDRVASRASLVMLTALRVKFEDSRTHLERRYLHTRVLTYTHASDCQVTLNLYRSINNVILLALLVAQVLV